MIRKISSDKPLKVIGFTDTHIDDYADRLEVTLKMIQVAVKEEKPDLILFVGDNVTGGDNRARAERFEQMMTELSTISFAINDLTLYLDTHPNCPNGLTLFKELLQKRLDLLADFADKFYPLTQISMITGDKDTDCYGWSEGPAPWEGGLI